ncbi:PTS sugar transporter subunit IIA [Enterococcus gallinarum]|uniref:PTS sugar transporter subunit IIA n=1 Tax=Enterococcus gallinarum TaxID=1353 RepID=UPI003CC72C20
MITDLFGGSVNNEFFNYVGKQAMHLISGLNLATLIEIYTQINTVDSLVDLVKRAVENGQESLCYCNELSSKEILEEEF